MPFLSPAAVEAARVLVRQAAETVVTSAFSPSIATSIPATSPPVTSASATATPTGTSTDAHLGSISSIGDPGNSGGGGGGGGGNGESGGNGGGGGGGGNGNSSSLLFFVALGFGVVFTNLWIIVGVKYCFRYNARTRQMRSDPGNQINMETVPRPNRRRREKKLMPIDEVNEKFPMQKYKTWVASRAQEGLSTRGGVSSPQSRPNSIHDADGVAQELTSKERGSTDDRPTTSATATVPPTEPAADPAADPAPDAADKPGGQGTRHVPKESTSSTVAGLTRASTESNRDPESAAGNNQVSQASREEDEEDEHIDAALPPECVGTSGDTCAICIDTLEDDDDVRGLTCGHAFHAVCIDPWLTTRRACCPLCKADYYTPKPRPPAAETGEGTPAVVQVTLPHETRADRMNIPGRPLPVLFGFGRMDRSAASSSRARETGGSAAPGRRTARPSRATPAPDGAPTGGLLSGLRRAMPTFRFGRGRNDQTGSEAAMSGGNTTTTPSQLEAGVRSRQR
ncbi:hypothetical protein VTH06DRAFT_4826 [Thermothelomyces fergusii]